jgi:ParB-like chromosome segregation protein Spo0J
MIAEQDVVTQHLNGHDTRRIDEIVWRKDLYPRFEPDPATIQRYAESIELLPPIQINQRKELIDGYHRWTAHKKVGAALIPVAVTETASDAEVLRLAIQTNATHGLQLSLSDKQSLARKLYTGDKEDIARLLSVTPRTVANWVANIDQAQREERQQRIRDLWLACHTQEEIAGAVGIPQRTVADQIEELAKMENFPKSLVLSAEFNESDWSPPLFDIWNFSKLSNTTGHFGNSEQGIVDNLLYLYTEPFDIVVDPFAGGGSTIDVCKKRLRRYWVSDRLPVPERQDIRQAEIAEGPPALHKRWQDVSLLYLDPPYWRQARNQYSQDAADLANMPLEQFYETLVTFVDSCSSKMRAGSHIALLIQPTQWLADDRAYPADHVIDLIQRVGKPRYVRRISCPYSTEQYNAQQVEWAKANREVLMRTRELIVWQVR